jgi:WD40 repeat protein
MGHGWNLSHSHRTAAESSLELNDKMIRIWNVTTGEVEAELKGHTNSVRSVAFSQDSSQVVSGSDNTVRIWNVTTGEVDAELKGHTDSVTSVSLSQDGSRVTSGSDDKTVRIWNATTDDHTRWVTILAGRQANRLWIRRQNAPNLECGYGRGGG